MSQRAVNIIFMRAALFLCMELLFICRKKLVLLVRSDKLQVGSSWTTISFVLKWSSAGDYRMHSRSPKDLGSFPSGATVYKYVVFYMHVNTHLLTVQIPALPNRQMTSRKFRLVSLPLLHFTAIFTTASVLLILLANTQCKHAALY